jgi:hypothetical protein
MTINFGKGVVHSGHSLVYNTTPAFEYREWKKSQKNSSHTGLLTSFIIIILPSRVMGDQNQHFTIILHIFISQLAI